MTGVTLDIGYAGLVLGYLLLIIPTSVALYYGVAILKELAISTLRMTVQLLFVGFYLHIVFKLNLWWLNLLWLLVMVVVADVSIIQSVGFSLKRFLAPMFFSILVGTAIPLLYFIGVIVQVENLFEAQYFIPIGGMIMGNCLRANIIGIGNFYKSIKKEEKPFLNLLAQGASLKEAYLPFLREAYQSALAPTLATIATIGLVSLPGMMTGIILGGTSPATAIKYQIAIMIAIFVGTSITVITAILLTIKTSFTPYGTLDKSIFNKKK
ncbi:MAG: ABC transporter permease [Myxococcota bacterium]